MTEEDLKKIAIEMRNVLLENECIFHVVVLKTGDGLRAHEFYKKCYPCIGHNSECKDYEPCFPKRQP